jgi:hypothetical protein
MNDVTIARSTGVFGIACVALTFGQFPLWLVGSPSVYDGDQFAQHLFAIKNAFLRILMDQGIWFLVVSLMLIRGHARAERSCAPRNRETNDVLPVSVQHS